MRVSLISDTHAKHGRIVLPKEIRSNRVLPDLVGGDLLIHAGDFMTSGYSKSEVLDFFTWLNEIEYTNIVFIAGNHDRFAQVVPDEMAELVARFPKLTYLEDDFVEIVVGEERIKIYGSPWQPWFHNWAFNLPRGGEELGSKWEAIPEDTDIVITHGPAQGRLDTSGEPWNTPNLGCELLTKRLVAIKPKMHVCGHIHGGRGHEFDGDTHYFNASILDESYHYSYSPFNFDWNVKTNEVSMIQR